MILRRNQFFLLLFIIFVAPAIVYKMVWIVTATKTTGYVWYKGGSLEGLGTKYYPVIRYKAGKDSAWFNGNLNMNIKQGEKINVLYHNVADATIDTPLSIWINVFVYSMFPALVLFVLFITPDSLDPLIPRRSKIVLARKPFIKIIPLQANHYH